MMPDLTASDWRALRSLPHSVRHSVWVRVLPSRAGQSIRAGSLWQLKRLARLSPDLWMLRDKSGAVVDWRDFAVRLDDAARVHAVARNLSDEGDAHAAIAATLRKAAGLLIRDDAQTDPLLHGLFGVLAHMRPDVFKPYDPKHWIQEREPRLSAFLRATADLFDGTLGVRVHGLHRLDEGTQVTGVDGAAALAAKQLVAVMRACSGRPQSRWVNHIVQVYHPNATAGKDWADAARHSA